MGRKSTAKQHRPPSTTSTPPGGAPPSGAKSPSALVIAAVVLLVAVVGLIVYTRSPQPSADTAKNAAAAQPAAPAPPAEPPVWAKLGPHPQASLPPLPFSPSPPARPADVVRASYQFAAEHPEVLSYVPCYCGCEHSGHRGNEDCFVTTRDANGDVTEWEPHGMT